MAALRSRFYIALSLFGPDARGPERAQKKTAPEGTVLYEISYHWPLARRPSSQRSAEK